MKNSNFVWVWTVQESFFGIDGSARMRMVGFFPENEASAALCWVEEHGIMDFSVSAELYKVEWLKLFEKQSDGMFKRMR